MTVLLILSHILPINLESAKAAEPAGSGKLIPHWGEPVWSEEFNVDGAPDPNIWSYQLASRNNPQEQQYYTDRPENVRVEDGSLILELRKDNAIPNNASDWFGSYANSGGYTSGFIYTNPARKDFLFGRIEFRAKLPLGSGSWPALWTTGNGKGWPSGGEIDVMEFWGSQEQPSQAMPFVICGTAHWYDDNTKQHAWEMNYFPCPDPSADWHIYAMEWDSQGIRYFFDDISYAYTDITPAVRNELASIRQALRLNLAFDGAANSPITNLKMYVDYVREFQLQPGMRIHSPPSVSTGNDWSSGTPLYAFKNQPLPIIGDVSGDGMPGAGYTCKWEQLSGPATAVFADPSKRQTSVTFPSEGSYRIRLVAHDGQYGDSSWRQVEVTNGSGNTAPIAAMANRTVMVGYPLKLKPVVVDDGLPNATTSVSWGSFYGVAPNFSATNVLEPTVTFNMPGTSVLWVSASDGALDGSPNLVTINIVAAGTNTAPQVSAGGTLSANIGTAVQLKGSVEDDGFPEFSTTQQWTQISGPATATIDEPTWVKPRATFPAGGTYVLRLTATDGQKTTSADLTVNVASGTTVAAPVFDPAPGTKT